MSSSWRTPYAATRALVLGGTGFIGRWVARELVAAGADLTVTVRSRVSAAPMLAQWGIRAAVVEASFSTRADVRRVLDDARPDIVFNMVGYGVDRTEQDPETMRLLNCEVVRWLADELAHRPCTAWEGVRLVTAGSALEYGRCGGILAEDVLPRPFNSYGETKLAGTIALQDAARASGLRALTARLFTVYGPGEHPGRLLPSLCDAAAQQQPVMLSSGEQRRDFTYVAEVAEGLLRLGVSPSAPGEVINVATGRLATVREFALAAASVLAIPETSLRFGAVPTRPDEMPHERVGVERLQRLTGWHPSISMVEGVRAAHAFTRSIALADSPRRTVSR